MIEKINLQFGSAPSRKSLEIKLAPITVFVGPNNSGKSKVLQEIEHYCRFRKQNNQVVLNNITFTPRQHGSFQRELESIEQKPKPNEIISPEYIKVASMNMPGHVGHVSLQKEKTINEAISPNTNIQGFYNQYLSLFTLRLDGTNRLNLCKEQPAGDLLDLSQNYISHAFEDNGIRSEIRRITYEAFERYFVIDALKIGYLRVRLSKNPPVHENVERGWTNESKEFHKRAQEINLASDGVKAFTGIVMSLLAGKPKITLIDEPEAFLHPALSNKLGREVGKMLRSTDRRLFAATHSANFLMGCIQSGVPLNIVRLTYKDGVPTARVLQKDNILELMRRPLLRSTNVLNGLFHESVIVTESDSDRAFYQEVNERLLNENDSRGIANCLFLNAQNKQTVWEIVKPLRELGIPTAGIVDVDFLKDGGRNFTKALDSAFVPELSRESLGVLRSKINDTMNKTGKDMKKEGGIAILDDSGQEACSNFLNQLKEYGIFVVQNGELESWLPSLGCISGHGPSWLISVFEKMGDNPDSSDYVKPSDGDVWDFVGSIKGWIDNQNRKGIP